MRLGPAYEHHVGTPNFMSPEAINGKANDCRSDLWSLGCTVYQMIVGVPPFQAKTPFLVMMKAQQGKPWMPKEGLADLERDLVCSLLRVEPSERLGADDTRAIMEHPMLRTRPTRAPDDAPLAHVLRLAGRAAVGEAEAAAAADAAAAERGGAEDWDGERAWPGQPEAEPGAALAGLLRDLREAGEGPEEALAAAVRTAASATSPVSFGGNLAEAAFALPPEALSSGARLSLARFAELAAQLLREAAEEFDFGGSQSEEEEEEEEEDEEDGEREQERAAEGGRGQASRRHCSLM